VLIGRLRLYLQHCADPADRGGTRHTLRLGPVALPDSPIVTTAMT
jgi:hypothetical protein